MSGLLMFGTMAYLFLVLRWPRATAALVCCVTGRLAYREALDGPATGVVCTLLIGAFLAALPFTSTVTAAGKQEA